MLMFCPISSDATTVASDTRHAKQEVRLSHGHVSFSNHALMARRREYRNMFINVYIYICELNRDNIPFFPRPEPVTLPENMQ